MRVRWRPLWPARRMQRSPFVCGNVASQRPRFGVSEAMESNNCSRAFSLEIFTSLNFDAQIGIHI